MRQGEELAGIGVVTEVDLTMSINARRQIAFTASIDRDSHLLVADAGGLVTVVLRKGDRLDLGDGATAEVSTIRLGTSGLNDAGQLAIGVNFRNGDRAVVRVTL